MLSGDGEAVAALLEKRDRRLRSEQAAQVDRREQAMREAAELDRQIGRMVAALAAGAESQDVVQAISERRAKIEALKATPPEPERFDRAEFFRRFRGSRAVDMLLCASYPAQVRQAFKRLGVGRVVVRPDGSFSGDLDGQAVLGHTGDSRALRGLPQNRVCAGKAGARTED